MKSKLKYGILLLAAIVILYFLFANKKTSDIPTEVNTDDGHCITPPANFKKYDHDVNWGDFAKGVRDYLGEYDTYAKYALAFLKGIDVEGKSTYVKYYQDEIRAYMKSNKALPNWEVLVGQFNCESNGVFPGDVVLN